MHSAAGGCCDSLPPYTETVSHAPGADVHRFEDTHQVHQVIPRVIRNVQHVYHRQDRVHHVVHDIEQRVRVQNVRVHHNLVREQTRHHYRHRTTYVPERSEQHLHAYEKLPDTFDSDCSDGCKNHGGW